LAKIYPGGTNHSAGRENSDEQELQEKKNCRALRRVTSKKSEQPEAWRIGKGKVGVRKKKVQNSGTREAVNKVSFKLSHGEMSSSRNSPGRTGNLEKGEKHRKEK